MTQQLPPSKPNEHIPPCEHPGLVLLATILGSAMAFVDGTVVNVILPVLQSELPATLLEAQWVVESYALFLASLILIGGVAGDRFGRRRVFVWGVVLFAIASAGCGLAQTATQLIVARAIQGVGGALLVPGSLALISASFPEKDRGKAIGTWSAFSALTAAIGPVLGGWLVEHASWRWAFFINIPIAAVVIAVSLRAVRESRGRETPSLDVPGAALATLGLGALTYGLIESSHLGLSHPVIVASLAGAAIALTAFVMVERKSAAPMLPPSLFASKTFTGANLLTFFLYAGLGAGLFFLPFNLIQIQGYGPTAAGAAMLPFILCISFLSRWSGGMVTRLGVRTPLFIGSLIVAAGYILLMVPTIGGSYWSTFFPGILVLGLGMAVCVAPLTTAVMNSVDPSYAGVASGVNNAVSRTASLLALAVYGLLALSVFTSSLNAATADLGLSAQAQEELHQETIKLAETAPPKSATLDQQHSIAESIRTSFVSSFRVLMGVSAGLSVLSALIAVLMLGSPKVTTPDIGENHVEA